MKVIKTINIIALNKEKTQICLVKRTSEDKNKEKWALIGEQIKTNETNQQAISRILKDNMNCTVSEIKELKKSETRTKSSVIKSQYLTGVISGTIKFDERKMSTFKWFNIDKTLFDLEFAFNQKVIIQKFFDNINK